MGHVVEAQHAPSVHLAAVRREIVDGDVAADISLLENRSKFLAVMQGGVVKAGSLA